MKHEDIDRLFEEASKVLHMDQSHDAIRQKIQGSLSAAYRAANANSDSSSYYNTPYVRDVYGDGEAGTVVHSKDGKLTASKYKKQGDGSYALSNHKSVKQAYVSDNDADDKKESMTMLLDGREVVVSEAAVEMSEVVELQEAKAGAAKITLITAGKGSMGFYTEAALKKAAENKVFNTGTQMFLNHQTKEERAARPEGDITKLAATLTAPAVYVEGSGSQPGRLVAPAKIYPEYKDFIEARKDDIGVSVRVGCTPSGKVQDGVPLVENMVYSLSADFVTKAGRGGKIEEMYESFRVTNPVGGLQPQEERNEQMTDQEKQDHAKLITRLDRLEEANTTLRAESFVNGKLGASGLKPRGQDRVRRLLLSSLPMKDGELDTAKLEESVKTAVTEELAYLQESGVQVGPKIVRNLGPVAEVKDDSTELSEAEVAKNAETLLNESVGALLGRKEKTA